MPESRDEIFARQRAERGWDDRETWSLDYTVAKFMLPRLQRFREVKAGHPAGMTMEEWQEILGKIEFALTCTIKDLDDDNGVIVPQEDHEKWQEGNELLGKWFNALWW